MIRMLHILNNIGSEQNYWYLNRKLVLTNNLDTKYYGMAILVVNRYQREIMSLISNLGTKH